MMVFDGFAYDGYMDSEEDNYLSKPPYTGRQWEKYNASADKHLPNKNEGRELRKIMSETGLTEEEVRGHKKYRKQLADARSREGNKDAKERFLRKIVKKATKELRLAKEHPKVIEKIKELIQAQKNDIYFQPRWLLDL